MREAITSDGHVAATPHDLATRAALATMESGGNAVDAAIAANAVLTVVAPETCGIGGDLFALIHRPGETEPLCLNASGRAGSNVNAAALRAEGHGDMPNRHLATITVPGCVDGWEALARTLGTRTIGDLIGPAIEYAENGFEASEELARTLAGRIRELSTQASGSSFYRDGHPAVEGETVRRPLLAATLRSIALGGRDAFYGGRFGSALVKTTKNLITADDLTVDQAQWVEPLGLSLFGTTAWTVPPNSQGYVTLATLGIFELLDPPDDPADPDFQHLLVESYRAANFDRDDHATDPNTAPLTGPELVAGERLADRAAQVDRNRAATWPSLRPVPGGTAFLCTIDRAGMAVSFIQSNFHGIGSGYSAGDTGVWLHNRGAGFSLQPGHNNELMPGRRPLHTLAPTLWTADGRLSMLLGTRGGQLQPQLLAQMAAAILRGATSLEEAQRLPRWALEGNNGPLLVEPAMTAAAGLAERGHAIERQAVPVGAWGPVSVISVDESGQRKSAADPRSDTASVRSGSHG